MNEFTNYLERLIEERGTNKYQISKSSGLDRTTLQRLLKGQRLPGLAFIERLCDYLCVTSVQRDKVRDLYQIQKIGKGTYQNRLYIKNTLENLNNINKKIGSPVSIGIILDDISNNEIIILDKRHNIQSMLRNIIEDELWNNLSPIIKLNVPFSFGYLFDALRYNCNSLDKNYRIEHIIKLNKNPKELIDSNHNLKTLSKILPLVFHNPENYIPYYFYGSIEYAVEQETLMPYFILTSKYLLQLSNDFSSMILNQNKEYYNLYLNYFQRQKESFRKLITPLTNAVDHLLMHTENIGHHVTPTCAVQPQPCFGVYYTNELIEEMIRDDLPNREFVIENACKLFHNVRESKTTLKNYFLKSGLDDFVANGRLVDMPAKYIYEITKEERLYFLSSLYEDIENDIYYCRAINPSQFDMSQNSPIAFYESLEFIIFNQDDKGNITACYINEPTISNAFDDFILSLKDSDYIFNKEDTLIIIEEAIMNLTENN